MCIICINLLRVYSLIENNRFLEEDVFAVLAPVDASTNNIDTSDVYVH